MPLGIKLHRPVALSFNTRPWCDVPAAASTLHIRRLRGAGERATALAVSQGGDAARELAARARRASLVVVGPCTIKTTALSRRLFSSPRAAVVRRASCGLQRTVARRSRSARRRATPLAVSREEAQHASLPRARAAPRWLWSSLVIQKDTTPERRRSPSARGRGATCQLWPPTHSRRSCGAHERTTAIAVTQEEAHYSSFPRSRVVPLWSWSVRALRHATASA